MSKKRKVEDDSEDEVEEEEEDNEDDYKEEEDDDEDEEEEEKKSKKKPATKKAPPKKKSKAEEKKPKKRSKEEDDDEDEKPAKKKAKKDDKPNKKAPGPKKPAGLISDYRDRMKPNELVATYATSSRLKCFSCKDMINKGDLSIGRAAGNPSYLQLKFWHVKCFMETRKKMKGIKADFRVGLFGNAALSRW
eukprot:TRINITY_DN8607_c0_g1_i1.p1 TRINITY_DN8607_c0_g1~~TRINITY_DN8607_c0_g1_i1.p1  ORF type:complete len:191 (-),score=75.84 TRINITY_DN8607_c0_g1_i1:58-630(-)